MRLFTTVESASSGERRDAIVSYSPESTVGDLASHLAGLRDRPEAAGSNVVAIDPARRRTASEVNRAPDVYLGMTKLDPGVTIDASDVRHGAVLGLRAPSTHQEIEPEGLVEVRVSSGRGAGRVHRLGIGTTVVGSGQHCQIRIDDPDVPDEAATLTVDLQGAVHVSPAPGTADLTIPAPLRREPATEPIVLQASSLDTHKVRRRRRKTVTEMRIGDRVDPLAPVPMIHLDRRPVTEDDTTWQPGDVLGIGHVLLEQVEITEPDASLSRSPSLPELDYNRPPRLHPAPRVQEFSLPTEPRRPEKMPIPFLMVISPMLMSGSMFFITRSMYSLIFMVMMPMMMLLNASGSRRTQKRRYQEQLEEFRKRRVQVEEAAVDSLLAERSMRRSTYPDPASVLLFATGPRARLWERRRWDPDFLTLRVGTSDLPSDVVVQDGTREAHEGPLRWTAPDVPVTISMGRTGVLGVAGQADECRTTASWLLAQTAALHSPTDASVWVFTDPDGADQWDWTKWLPHTRNDDDHPRPVKLALDEQNAAGMISELSGELEARKQVDEKSREGLSRILVVLDGARELRMSTGMISLLKDGPSVHMYFICLDRTSRQLPEECRAVLEHRDGTLNLETTEEHHLDAIRPDGVGQDWLDRLARALAPIRDVSTEDLSSSLPASSRLLDVLHLEHPSGEALTEGWLARGRTTRAVIGEGIDGPFTIDVRADGPHGLIAGTTGSGKSELLQTIIASLAVGNRPDEFNFVLIDYKGGAAFKDCQHLPHTVGMVTDLDGHLTTRALDSLGAELRRREHQLADADAKDIEDYIAGRKAGDEPMPRLLIVIDEFAALVAELPDFVTGLVDVARRGRSLGVHLILATQRPAGVVNAEIKSNTNLRIALRVTDGNDSDDVIESPVAARISKSFPGRAYARLGHSSLTPFQSSRVGGRPRGSEADDLASQAFGWRDLPQAGQRAVVEEVEDDVSTPTDLANLVAAIQSANDLIGLAPMRKPWLPPLPEQLSLDSLSVAAPEDGVIPPIPLGRSDIPHLQQQVDEVWDLEGGGHLMIAGQSRSGRSSSLRVLAGAIARQCSPADVHLYGLDAGNNALLPLVSLPHVGAVVTRTQVDRVYRLLDFLQKELARRQQSLAEHGFADIGEQRRAAGPGDRMPYLVVLLDRLEGYTAAFESVDGGVLVDRITGLLQEGAGVGIRFVIAADRSGVLGRISTLVEDRIMLSMSDPSDFSAIGLSNKEVPSVMSPGRAFRGGERPREMQWALLDETGVGTDQVRALHEIGRSSSERFADLPRSVRPQRIDELPASLGLAEAMQLDPLSPSPSFVPVGVGGDTLSLQGFDPLTDGPGFLVAGPPRSGKSNALQVIVRQQLDQRRQVVVFTPRISPLRDQRVGRHLRIFTGDEPINDIKDALASLSKEHTVVVDDFDVIGADSPLGQALAEHFATMRDTTSVMVVAANIDEILSLYRGLPVELKRGRTGLVLAPRSSSDGDVLNARLPRSVGASLPVGRGVLTHAAGWRWVQVPKV
ncbi:FtsK/SpoIIIE domain-containing protein [Aeromicrobium panaciterrae]|uniref:FtsK/SpoIIIE domain-containing protein n=1 Tax=Aeromicrobium panaciterrae TaxID=363861 RepID=UPI0031E13B3A